MIIPYQKLLAAGGILLPLSAVGHENRYREHRNKRQESLSASSSDFGSAVPSSEFSSASAFSTAPSSDFSSAPSCPTATAVDDDVQTEYCFVYGKTNGEGELLPSTTTKRFSVGDMYSRFKTQRLPKAKTKTITSTVTETAAPVTITAPPLTITESETLDPATVTRTFTDVINPVPVVSQKKVKNRRLY